MVVPATRGCSTSLTVAGGFWAAAGRGLEYDLRVLDHASTLEKNSSILKHNKSECVLWMCEYKCGGEVVDF